MKKILPLLLLASLILITSCSKQKEEVKPIKGLQLFQDSIYKMEFKYPENWDFQGIPGHYNILSDKIGKSRFKRYKTKGKPVARIQFKRIKVQKDSNTRLDFDEILDKTKRFENEYYKTPDTIIIDGVKAIKNTYAFQLNDGMFGGVSIFAEKDSNSFTFFSFETFADGMETFQKDVDEIIASLKFAQTPPPRSENDTLFIGGEELPLPSEDTKLAKGKGYTLKIPKNFKAMKGSGNYKYSKKYEGERRGDSYLTLDIIDASKQKNLKKIVDKSASAMNGKVSAVKFAGQDGFVIDVYLAKYKIVRKLYFAKKGDDMYRLTVDYNKAEEAPYKKAFDKAVKSFKLK